MPRALAIVNPYATAVTPALREAALRTLARAFELEALDTDSPGHAIELARRASAERWDAVVALGGDGTINEVANGLTRHARARLGATRGEVARTRSVQRAGVAEYAAVHAGGGGWRAEDAPEAPREGDDGTLGQRLVGGEAAHPGSPVLVCVPGGQANVFVRMLGLPASASEACERLVGLAARWGTRRIDLGAVNDRSFTFASGVGIDASVTQAVDANPRLKARLGAWYYAWVALAIVARRYRTGAPRMVARLPGTAGGAAPCSIEGIAAVVQNGSTYTYFNNRPVEMAEGSALDSGTLAGGVLRRAQARDVPSFAWRALSSRASISGHAQVSAFSGLSGLTIYGAGGAPLPVHVDGDYLGELAEARYEVRPGALEVLAPPNGRTARRG
jgi:diacylglycerol kinase family enzyme